MDKQNRTGQNIVLIGEQIKKARKAAGLSQESLAQNAGVSRSLIANAELGSKVTENAFQKIKQALPNDIADKYLSVDNTIIADSLIGDDRAIEQQLDTLTEVVNIRRSSRVDLSGHWNARWLTVTGGKENRNSERISFNRRWNGSWMMSNEAISDENLEGGYLWVGRLELFDNRHLLGYYIAKSTSIQARGTLCLEVKPNGREIIGTWEGLNFDTMWANGLVALCKEAESKSDPDAILTEFMNQKPKMPYKI